MSRYNIDMGVEGECQPGSKGRVLKNLLDIRKKTEMDHIEYEAYINVHEKYFNADMITSDTKFTAEIIKTMHFDWLGSIYEWAGEYRSVDMRKGDFQFPPAFRVAENMEKFENEILTVHTPCNGDDLSDICRSLAIVHAELLLIHPLREGNRRLARWLAEMMAAQADLPFPDYGFTGIGSRKRKTAYLNAVLKGYTMDYDDLVRFLILRYRHVFDQHQVLEVNDMMRLRKSKNHMHSCESFPKELCCL